MEASDLRKAILQYAMEGKLVKQDSNDEPASVLLERIKDEKNKLIKEGKIKKDNKESYIYKGDDNHYYEKIGSKVSDITEEIPFEIPNTWELVRLKYLGAICSGGTPARNVKIYWENGDIPWLKISDLSSAKKYVNSSSEYITRSGMNSSSAKIIYKGSILYTIFATIGVVRILNFDATCNQAIAAITPYKDDITNYLYYFLINLETYIKSFSHGPAQQNINLSILSNTIIPLPPLSEQERIVNKLDELMPLVDEYEKLLAENKQLDNEFPDKLKQSILQYAMEGKLVKQDPNDEPASVLLEKIKQEKEKLIKEGKIKRDKNESIIYQGDDKNYYEKIGNDTTDLTDEIPFEIPEKWSIAKLASVCNMFIGDSISENVKNKKYKNRTNGLNYIGTKDVNFNHTINYQNGVKIPLEDNFRIAHKGSTLLCVEGGSAGRKIAITEEDVCFGNKLCAFESYEIDGYYLYYYLQSPIFTSIFKDNINGIIGGVSINNLKNLFIFIPPLSEQHRIVNRINELFTKLF